LVTLRDVTLDRELQAKSRDQSEEIMVISTIVQGDPRLFGMFLKSSRVSLHRAFELAQKGGSTGKAYPELHRILHTLKGNARTEKMQNLARLIHECEEKIQQGTMELEDLKPIERELRRYHKTFDRYFATHFTLDAVSIPRDELLTLNEFLKNQGFEKHARLVRSWLQKSLFSLTQLQSRLNAEIPRLAAELGKEPCMLHCSFENVYVNHEVFEALTDMCGHLLRNSLDHGLEAMAERIEGGKTPYGHIQVTFVNGSEPGIIWRDDGRGLNMQNILEKAKLLGLASPERDVVWDEEFCLKILTTSGFTTRHEASLISGRGVGLDAVNHRLNGIGGRLQLRFTSDIKGGKLQAFEFILWLPKQSLRAAESPASLPRAS
jgi:chemotaxis protein histidine kinase CheA